jgi:hypothetical protein
MVEGDARKDRSGYYREQKGRCRVGRGGIQSKCLTAREYLAIIIVAIESEEVLA